LARVYVMTDRCKGCLLCMSSCPKKIIIVSESINNMGYRPVMVEDQEKCIGCGFCTIVCPDLAITVEKEG